jgi:hypothetical protein
MSTIAPKEFRTEIGSNLGLTQERVGAATITTQVANQPKPSIVTLDMPIGSLDGPTLRKSGVAITIRRAANRRLLPNLSIATPGFRTGGLVGPQKRKNGAAIIIREPVRPPSLLIVKLAFPIGRLGGPVQKRHGVANTMRRVASPTGWDGLR